MLDLDHGISPAPRVITRSIFSHSNCAFSRLLIASEVMYVSECPENNNSTVFKEIHCPGAHQVRQHPTLDAGLARSRQAMVRNLRYSIHPFSSGTSLTRGRGQRIPKGCVMIVHGYGLWLAEFRVKYHRSLIASSQINTTCLISQRVLTRGIIVVVTDVLVLFREFVWLMVVWPSGRG